MSKIDYFSRFASPSCNKAQRQKVNVNNYENQLSYK